MKLLRICPLLVFFIACAGDRKAPPTQHASPEKYTLIGQLLLPAGTGSRGVEVTVKLEPGGSGPPKIWVLFDEQGRFSHTFAKRPIELRVTAGIGREVHRMEAEQLGELTQAGQADLGAIDLRDQLAQHRIRLRAAEGKPAGEVRVGMWFGPPPTGPRGEPVSLGSRQFPPVPLGSETEWLLPHGAEATYFLVERPAGPAGSAPWRSGHQRLFGPYDAHELPTELVMD